MRRNVSAAQRLRAELHVRSSNWEAEMLYSKVNTRRVPVQRAVEREEKYPTREKSTLRPLLNIMDYASRNPAADAAVRNLLSRIVI